VPHVREVACGKVGIAVEHFVHPAMIVARTHRLKRG